MRSKLGVVLLWILIFLLGGIAGAVSHYLYCDHLKATSPASPARKSSDEIINEMALFLRLDASQKESLKTIFDESRMRYRELNQQYQPQYKAIRNETNERIKGMLREDQKSRFEEWIKRNAPTSRKSATTPAPAK